MALSSPCLALLKLDQQPFDPQPNEAFLYTDPLLDTLNDTGRRALNRQNTMIFLSGDVGSGRSTQLIRLLSALPNEFELIAFRGRSNTSFAATEVTLRNHLRAHGYDQPDRSVTELLAARIQTGAEIVIAIDDAHLLGAEIVRLLINLRSAIIGISQRGPRLVLVGDAAFAQRHFTSLESQDLKQATRLNLLAFNLEQTRAYVAHRLFVAGHKNPNQLLSSDDAMQLHEDSAGSPAALNRFAEQWLHSKCQELQAAAVAPPPAEPKPEQPPTPKKPQPTAEPAPQSEPVPSSAAVADTNPQQQPEPKQAKRLFWQQRWFIPAVVGFLLIVVGYVAISQLPDPDETTSPLAHLQPRSNRDPSSTNDKQDIDVTAPNSAEMGERLGAMETLEMVPIDDPLHEQVSLSIEWLSEQDPNHYTIQLAALSDFSAIENYILEHQLTNVRIIPTQQEVLAVTGSFPNRASAQNAVAQLPANVRNQGYWIRRLGEIQL